MSMATVADFDENPIIPIKHDQIQFTTAQRDVGGDELQPLLFEIQARTLFKLRA